MTKASKDKADRENDAAGAGAVITLTTMFGAPPTIVALMMSTSHIFDPLTAPWAISLIRSLTIPFVLVAAFHWFLTAGAIVFSGALFLREASSRSRTIALLIAGASLWSSLYIRSNTHW